MSKSHDPLYHIVGRFHVIVNEVNDLSYDSQASLILLLQPPDDTPTRDFDMALPVRHIYELALV